MKTNYLTTILALVAISLLPTQSYAKKSAVVAVLDANNNQVGVLFDAKENEASVIIEKDGVDVLLFVQKDGFVQDGFVIFTQLDCLGTAIILPLFPHDNNMILRANVANNQVYFSTGTLLENNEFIYSMWDGNEEQCMALDPPFYLDLDHPDLIGDPLFEIVSPIDLSDFTPPFRFSASP
jgi:hypothetical protein